MALTKKIQIDGQDVVFRASAAIPRIYRLKFGRDIFKDLMELEKSMKKNDEDKSVPDSPEEWLDNFSTFSIYQILPQLIELWGLNIKSEEVPKKK